MDIPPYDKPTFKSYSGPYNRLTEYLIKIIEHFEEMYYIGVLSKYKIGLGIIVPKDENGVRELYKDSCYFFYELGKRPEPSPTSKYYSLQQVGRICKGLESGEIVLPNEQSDDSGGE